MAIISIGYTAEFKDAASGNHVVGIPKFVAQFVNNGENPFREFLSELPPGCLVNIQITLQAVNKT